MTAKYFRILFHTLPFFTHCKVHSFTFYACLIAYRAEVVGIDVECWNFCSQEISSIYSTFDRRSENVMELSFLERKCYGTFTLVSENTKSKMHLIFLYKKYWLGSKSTHTQKKTSRWWVGVTASPDLPGVPVLYHWPLNTVHSIYWQSTLLLL